MYRVYLCLPGTHLKIVIYLLFMFIFLYLGAKTNPAFQCYYAQKDPELCQECTGETHYYQRRQSRCCQLGCHPGMFFFLCGRCVVMGLADSTLSFEKPYDVKMNWTVLCFFVRAQEVEYVKEEAKMVYLLECLQKTPPPVSNSSYYDSDTPKRNLRHFKSNKPLFTSH